MIVLLYLTKKKAQLFCGTSDEILMDRLKYMQVPVSWVASDVDDIVDLQSIHLTTYVAKKEAKDSQSTHRLLSPLYARDNVMHVEQKPACHGSISPP